MKYTIKALLKFYNTYVAKFTEHFFTSTRVSLQEKITTFFKVDKKAYLDALWEEFLKETEKYYREQYPFDIDNTKSIRNFDEDRAKSTFANHFAKFFQKQVQSKIALLEENNLPIPQRGEYNKTSITATSLQNNYLKVNGFSGDVRDSTLVLFCLFLGYNSFEDFKNKKKISLLPSIIRWYLKHPHRVYSVLVVVLAAIVITVFLKTGAPSDNAVKNVIIAANQMEYNAYRKLTDFDTTQLDKYWTKGIARTRILTIVKKHSQLGRILIDTLKTSGAKIIDFEVTLKTRYYIRLKTEEHWKLLWYNINTKSIEKPYDRVDDQIYELVKVNGQWKIWDSWHIKKPEEIIIGK